MRHVSASIMRKPVGLQGILVPRAAPHRLFNQASTTWFGQTPWNLALGGLRMHGTDNRRSSGAGASAQLLRLRSLTEEQMDELATCKETQAALTVINAKVLAATEDAPQAEVYEPTERQYILYYRDAFIPFVFFGMLDNSIMLLFGDFFDYHLGYSLGITTLTAAALGNVVGDCAGIWLTGTVEAMVNRFQLEHHGLSFEQRRLTKSQTIKTLGMTSGIFVGCILGMFPLIWPEDYRLWEARPGDKTSV